MRAIAPRPRFGTGHEAPRGPAPVVVEQQPAVDLTPVTDRLDAAEAAISEARVKQGKQAEAIAVLEAKSGPVLSASAEVFR